jgi:hypothetical protein
MKKVLTGNMGMTLEVVHSIGVIGDINLDPNRVQSILGIALSNAANVSRMKPLARHFAAVLPVPSFIMAS